MSDVFDILSRKSTLGIDAYGDAYVSLIHNVIDELSKPGLLSSHIVSNRLDEAELLLRCSLIFNQLTLYTVLTPPLRYTSLRPEWFRQRVGAVGIRYTIPKDVTGEFGVPSGRLSGNLALIFPTGDALGSHLSELTTLIKQRRLLFQPYRAIVVPRNELKNPSLWKDDWIPIEVKPESPLDHWEAKSGGRRNIIPLHYDANDHLNHTILFEISVPYVRGIPLKDLGRLIENEGSTISPLRRALKEAIEAVGTGQNTRSSLSQEIVHDLVNPQLAQLEGTFREAHEQFRHQFATSGVMTISMALMAATWDGPVANAAAVLGLKEFVSMWKASNALKAKTENMKQNPFYFYWKCKGIE